MLKTFTRGGQVTLHNIRMLRQVAGVTLGITLILGTLVFGFKSWMDYTPYERSAVWAYYWADFKLNFPLVRKEQKPKMTQRYMYPDGSRGIVRSLDIVNDAWSQQLVGKVNAQLAHNAELSLWGMLLLFVMACGGWVWRGKHTKKKKILSGPEIVEPKVLQRLLEQRKIASRFKLGGVSLRLNSEGQHLLFCGTTGTGKSNAFMELLPQIREQGHRAIVVDTTGEFVSRFYRAGKDILINPFDDRSVGWNPWRECQFPYHYDELSHGFIPQTGYDRFWPDAARTVFSEGLVHMHDTGSEDVGELVKLLLASPLKELYSTLKHTPAASLLDPTGDRTAMSIRAHLTPYLKVLKYLPKDREAFSVRDWVLNPRKGQEGSWVFLAATPDQRETLKPFLTCLLSLSFNSLMSAVPDLERRLWFIIDELGSLHKQESLPKALAEIRKYGGCVAAGVQDISQLQEQYGHAESKSLCSLFNTKVIFRGSDPETARYLSQMLGEQEVVEAMEGISYGEHAYRDGVSLSDQKRMKPLVNPTDIMALNDLEAYLKLPGDLPLTKVGFAIHKLPRVCVGFQASVQVSGGEEKVRGLE